MATTAEVVVAFHFNIEFIFANAAQSNWDSSHVEISTLLATTLRYDILGNCYYTPISVFIHEIPSSSTGVNRWLRHVLNNW